MTSKVHSLMLLQRVAKHADDALHCREVSLQLSPDQQHLTLTRYTECYSPDGMEWVERRHQVSVTELMRWVIEHGKQLELMHSAEPRQASA